MRRKGVKRLYRICMGRIIAAFILILGISSMAAAFEIPTGNPDTELRWDNTFRYNYGVRTLNPNSDLIGNPNYDDGNRNFNKGTVTNRLDILSELDLRYRKHYGFRISGAAWYDQRYQDPLGNDSVATSNHIVNGRQALGLGDNTKRFNAGPDAELMDAFVFGKVELGPVPLTVKAGRHTIFWGEALLFGGAINGISYSQMPIDAAKGFANPGTEAKELFRPLYNISAQAQLTTTFTISAQYFLQWEPYRFPEAGSFLSPADLFLEGSESMVLAPGVFFTHGKDQKPDGMKDWGIAAHWQPNWLGGVLGLYYRHFTDKLPQAHIELATGQFFFAYPDNIDLYGVSLSKEIYGVSVGMEYNYRHNMPLQSEAVMIMPGTPKPVDGETYAARGNTHQFVINFLGLISKTALWDLANWGMEFTYSSWDKVTQGEQYFLGRAGYGNLDRVSKDAWGYSLLFAPTWFNVFPGMDLKMPINFAMGISGNSALLFSDNLNAGNASAGFALDIYKRYNVSLSYNKYYGDFDKVNGVATIYRGSQALLSDRDYVAFTFKFTL